MTVTTSTPTTHTHFARLILLIALAAVVPLLRYTPLSGGVIALVLVVVAQVLLPGWLLAVWIKKDRDHPILNFVWVLLCGLALTITFGTLARLIGLPVSVFMILYAVGTAGALVWWARAGGLSTAPVHLRADFGRVLVGAGAALFTRRALPYLLLAGCCGVVLAVATIRTQFRFRGYADQTEFIAVAGWLANDPDDQFVYSRRLGVYLDQTYDVRYETDGWTYTHAAWVWASGVPAAELIWYALTPLFAWCTPLAFFALGYKGSGRAAIGAGCAAGVTLFGLLTLDALVYHPTNLAFGQFGLFQLNTARTFSLALMLPLTVFAALDYLHSETWRGLRLIALAGLALALLHPMQAAIFQLTIGATAGLWWLMQPRRRFKSALALIVVLGLLLIVPLLQRAGVDTLVAAEGSAAQFEISEENAPSYGLLAITVPVIGDTYIANPAAVFHHWMIVVGMICGLLAVFNLRRNGKDKLLALYLFAATLAALVVMFTPGLAALVGRFVVPRYLVRFVFALPVGVVVGWGGASAAAWGSDLLARLYAVRPSRKWLEAAGFLLALIMVFVPTASYAAHQIYASEQMQRTRDIQPFDAALLDALREVLPADQRSVILAPIGVDSLIIESLPNTFITGGRVQLNTRTYLPTLRFFDSRVPWLDEADITFLREYGVTHVIVQADDTRLPQLLLNRGRFELLATPAGFYIFRTANDLQTNPFDSLFAEMNVLYGDAESPRWENEQFHLARAGDPERWSQMVEQWGAVSVDDPVVFYGMAFAALLAGDDAVALMLWHDLHDDHTEIALFTDAAASTLREREHAAAGASMLRTALDHEKASTRVLAARTLLTEPFMYLLSDEDVDRVLAVIDADAITWAQLATYEQDQAVRERAALLMTKGERYYPVVSRWLGEIADAHQSAQDLMWRAQIALATGDTDSALDILRPATDADWVRAKAYLHPDRWQNNVAAQVYADVDSLAGLPAVQLFPYSANLLIREDEQAHILNLSASINNPTGSAYPVRFVRVRVTNPDATTIYGEVEMPVTLEALFMPVELSVTLPADLPELTPAKVVFQVLHSDTVVYKTSVEDVVLNRPAAATPPADATAGSLTFGESLTLENYTAAVENDQLRVGLYWQTSALLFSDYQVFVHVVNEAGEIVRQRDIAPVDGRYPTSQWRVDTLIEDVHSVSVGDLPTGRYRVRIGLYPLPEAVPLPISPTDDPRVENNTVYIYEFER